MSVDDPQRLRQLLDAVVSIGAGLDLSETLHRIIELATDLVDARYGALGVLDEDGVHLSEFITIGVDDDVRGRIGQLPEGHGILGVLILDARPLRLPDLGRHPESAGFPAHHPEMTSFLGVPIVVRDQVFGNLYLTEKTTGPEFTDVDEELVIGLAAAAGVAVENARLSALVAESALAEERQRIARDLHDTVIQRIFATALSLQGSLHLVGDDSDATTARIEAAIDDLDETVTTIRSTIFALDDRDRSGRGVRDRILAVGHESTGALGFAPRIVFDGPVDATADDSIADDVVATLREALSNVARHAGASAVNVRLEVEDTALVLTVVDDGVGIARDGDDHGGRGLENMRDRARRHGGSLVLDPGEAHGTVLTWRAHVT